MPCSWDRPPLRPTFLGVRGGTNVRTPIVGGRVVTLAMVLTAICATTSFADELWEELWIEWELQATAAADEQNARRIVVEELTVDGELRERREFSAAPGKLPQRRRGNRSGELAEAFGSVGDPAESIRNAPTVFFAYQWTERRYEPVEEPRMVAGIEARGVRVVGGEGHGVVWFDPTDSKLLLTVLYPTGGPSPSATVRYQPLVAARVHSVTFESVDDRGIFADRVRRMTIGYE